MNCGNWMDVGRLKPRPRLNYAATLLKVLKDTPVGNLFHGERSRQNDDVEYKIKKYQREDKTTRAVSLAFPYFYHGSCQMANDTEGHTSTSSRSPFPFQTTNSNNKKNTHPNKKKAQPEILLVPSSLSA